MRLSGPVLLEAASVPAVGAFCKKGDSDAGSQASAVTKPRFIVTSIEVA